jgi:hypothetical protein
MTKTYLIHAWCVRPFIAYLDPVEAATPEEAIAIARGHPNRLIDAAEECNGQYPWDEFAAYDEDGDELLHILDDSARLRDAAPRMQETLLYVAQMLADFKPDFLRQLGFDAALEQVEKALAIAEGSCRVPSSTADDGEDQP